MRPAVNCASSKSSSYTESCIQCTYKMELALQMLNPHSYTNIWFLHIIAFLQPCGDNGAKQRYCEAVWNRCTRKCHWKWPTIYGDTASRTGRSLLDSYWNRLNNRKRPLPVPYFIILSCTVHSRMNPLVIWTFLMYNGNVWLSNSGSNVV